MYSKYPFTLDIHAAMSQVSIPVTQGDTARRLYIGLTDGGEPFIVPEGCRAVLTAEKADGTHLLNDCIIEQSGAVIRYDFTEQTASAVGRVGCQVKLYRANGEVLAEPRFTLIVYEGYVDDDIISEDEKTTIDAMIVAEQMRVEAELHRAEVTQRAEEAADRANEAADRIDESVKGDKAYIAYAYHDETVDGVYYTEWARGMNYIGVYTGVKAPSKKTDYEWSVFSPSVYVGSGEMPDYADVQIDPEGMLDEGGISLGSVAWGEKNIAGSKAFRITFLNHHGNGEVFFYLDGYDGGYEVGDEVTIRINSYYDRCGIIQESDNSEVTVKLYDGVTISDDWINNPIDDQLTLRVPDKPNVGNIDVGVCASAFGSGTSANGAYSHAEGCRVKADGKYAHAEGVDTAAVYASHAEGRESKALGQTSHAEGWKTEAIGNYSHTEGHNTKATKDNAHAEGWNTTASGESSHSEGNETEASGTRSHAEGYGSKATANFTHAEGKKTTASGESAHAEGDGTKATARAAHAEGVNTTASAQMAHAEGYNNQATGEMAHAEGANTTASGKRAHAEGNGCVASGNRAHAEGETTTASGEASHAEGNHTQAKGAASHAGGVYTMAGSDHQYVIGRFNKIDTEGKYAFIVGNGTSETDRSNAMAVRWDGTLELSGVSITPDQLERLLTLI